MSRSENQVYIPIKDIDNNFSLKLSEELSKIEGLTNFNLEIENNRVLIEGKLKKILPKVIQEIKDSGYNIPSEKKSFPVVGMTCASCANTTQAILRKQIGVIEANVNYANTTANIEFITDLINPNELKEAIEEGGYDLIIDEENSEKSLEEIHEEQFKELKKKTIGSVIFSIPLVIIGMIPVLMHMPYANYIMWALATPVLYFGRQFYIGAYKQLKHKSSNMDTLVALSSGIAYIFSIFNTLFSEFWLKKGMEPHVYFETSAVIITFILLGKLLEEKAKGNTSSAIKKLIGLQPKTVNVLQGNEQIEIPIEKVKIGDIILVKPGEKIAVDGIVSKGNSFIDESMISGEPIPVEKKKGNEVFAGTINQKSSFQFVAKKVGSDTLLSQIIKAVKEAQGSKAPVQNLVDKIAGIFVPTVVIIAVISFIIWMILGGKEGFSHGLLALITVLVIACPCALGLATPTAIMVGMGKGAENGILIKDAESLETAKKINTIVLDKTGTITEGKPTVASIKWFENESSEYKDILFSMEKSSDHPLALSITDYLKNGAKFIEDIKIDDKSGKGILANYKEKDKNNIFRIGNPNFIKEGKISISSEQEDYLNSELEKAHTVVIFAEESKIISIISISDKIKSTSEEAINNLQEEAIDVYMLTGDNIQTAKAVAEQTGIKFFEAEVSPQGKVEFIKDLQNSKSKIVGMVGDGINDSAALAQADVSIAMGKGSDIAIDIAKITIISNDLTKIKQSIHLSKLTVKTIKQNLFWAFIYNLIGIPIAAGLLYPVNGFLLNPMLAGAAMALSSVSVVTNSLLLKWKKI